MRLNTCEDSIFNSAASLLKLFKMSFDTFWHKHQSNNAVILKLIAQCKMFPHLPHCPLKIKIMTPLLLSKM